LANGSAGRPPEGQPVRSALTRGAPSYQRFSLTICLSHPVTLRQTCERRHRSKLQPTVIEGIDVEGAARYQEGLEALAAEGSSRIALLVAEVGNPNNAHAVRVVLTNGRRAERAGYRDRNYGEETVTFAAPPSLEKPDSSAKVAVPEGVGATGDGGWLLPIFIIVGPIIVLTVSIASYRASHPSTPNSVPRLQCGPQRPFCMRWRERHLERQ